MTSSPITIIYTLIGGLILTGLVAWIRRSRLALLFPKLFIYSGLTHTGQLVELTIFNRGFRTEESIEVSLNPRLKYELVGATAQNVQLSESTVDISKLGASNDVTLILLVEGGKFGKDDVITCVSKETTGKLYASLENIPPTGQQRIAGLVAFFIVPAIIALLFFNVTDLGQSLAGKKEPTTAEEDGWVIQSPYKTLKGPLYQDFLAEKVQVEVENVAYEGDVATLTLALKNKSEQALQFTVEADTVNSKDKIPAYDRTFSDILVAPHTTKMQAVQVIIPPKAVAAFEKTIFLEIFIKQFGATNDSLQLQRNWIAELK